MESEKEDRNLKRNIGKQTVGCSLNIYISINIIIKLNVNGLNSSIKNQKLSNWIKN